MLVSMANFIDYGLNSIEKQRSKLKLEQECQEVLLLVRQLPRVVLEEH